MNNSYNNNNSNNNNSNGNRVIPLTCSGHTRPVVDIQFSPITADGKYFLISACKGKKEKKSQTIFYQFTQHF